MATKLSAEKQGELKLAMITILKDSDDALTIEQIKNHNPLLLSAYTTQRLARILNSLVDMGLVRKAKSKGQGRMVYKSVSKMVEQGYDMENIFPQHKAYDGTDWELEEEINNHYDTPVEVIED